MLLLRRGTGWSAGWLNQISARFAATVDANGASVAPAQI
jgi:hypothetical protein